MSHLDEGTLHALLDGEIPSPALSAVEEHLAQCRECQARMAEARAFRDEAFGLIESLDQLELQQSGATSAGPPLLYASPAPQNALSETTPDYQAPIAKHVASGNAKPQAHQTHRDRRLPRWAPPLAWAATIVLAVGLGYSWRGRIGPGQATSEQSAMDIRSPAVPADSAPEVAAGAAVSAATPPAPRAASPAAERAPEPAETRAVPRQEADPSSTAPTPAADRDAAKAAPAPPARASESPALNRLAAARKRVDDTTRALPIERPMALSEVVTAGAARRNPAISADSAIRLLGGSIRLIEGWNPNRYELVDSTVRVVYQTSYGEVTLDQWRTDRAVGHQLITPPEAPADSVTSWRSRIK